MERYDTRVRIFASLWFSLLGVLLIAVFVRKFSPKVYKTAHVTLILNNFIQLINTVQFYASFQLLRGLEFFLSIGTGREKIISLAVKDTSERDYASDMVMDSEVRGLYSAVQDSPSSFYNTNHST